jgi:three-Cys-motif partner protein
MPRPDINAKPFDEGTLTKLEVFQLYVREWLPVFLAREKIVWSQVHLFDFFCGSGTDSKGISGSPLRILEELQKQPAWLARRDVSTTVHFFDDKPEKIQELDAQIVQRGLRALNVGFDIGAGEFSKTFANSKTLLRSNDTACLVFLDQYGIKDVTEDVFKFLVGCPCTDTLFFISSAIFSRLGDQPCIRKYLDLGKPEDSHEAHRAVVEHFRRWIPKDADYYLTPFSIKKGSNVYGLVFGSGHPLGMEKFLRVAWKKDQLNGEANFDINREGLSAQQTDMFERPTKVTAFEADLRDGVIGQRLRTEADIYRFCISCGMTPSHAEPVIKALKKERLIECAWTVPQIKSLKDPRPFSLQPKV